MRITVLIIDSDLGLVFWLGRVLDQQGYETLPAKSVHDSQRLLNELQVSADVVILNAALPGATDFAVNLRREHNRVKIVMLISDGYAPIATLADWHIIKPSVVDDVAKMELCQGVLAVLSGTANSPPEALTAGRHRL